MAIKKIGSRAWAERKRIRLAENGSFNWLRKWSIADLKLTNGLYSSYVEIKLGREFIDNNYFFFAEVANFLEADLEAVVLGRGLSV